MSDRAYKISLAKAALQNAVRRIHANANLHARALVRRANAEDDGELEKALAAVRRLTKRHSMLLAELKRLERAYSDTLTPREIKQIISEL
jgi:hypothetical protein